MRLAGMDKWIHDISPEDRTSDVALRSLRIRLATVKRYLPLAAENTNENFDYVHELRVSTRRADTALKLFSMMLPRHRSSRLKKCLREIRRSASAAREYDVLCQRLTMDLSQPSAVQFLEKIRSERQKAYGPIQAVYQRMKKYSRFDRMVLKLLRRVWPRDKTTGKPKDPRFGKWALTRLRSIIDKYFKHASNTEMNATELHHFRIRTKELRYEIELLASALPPIFIEQIYPVIETLQQLLGEINDQVTLLDLLHQTIQASDDTSETEYLQSLYKAEQVHLTLSRQAFFEWWTPALRKEIQSRFLAIITGDQNHEGVSPQTTR